MTESRIDKIVDFEKYCKTCRFTKLQVDDNGITPEPCNECLGEPVNENSQKPVKYQPDEALIKKLEVAKAAAEEKLEEYNK